MNLVTLKDTLKARRDHFIRFCRETAAEHHWWDEKKGITREDIAKRLEAISDDEITNESFHVAMCWLPHRKGRAEPEVQDHAPKCSECGERKPAVVKIGPDYDPGEYEVGAVEEVWVCRECLLKALELLPKSP